MQNPLPLPRLSVVGLGKLGAPMVAVFAAKGFDVCGIDLNPRAVAAVNEADAPVEEPGLREMLAANRARIRATLDWGEAVLGTDVSFVIVPTPSGADGLFSNRFVIEAVERIGTALRNKSGRHVVVITSTVIPGSTGGEICRALERASCRTIGRELGLCYNPEFIALGSVIRDMLHPDMILIGESDPESGDLLEAIHRRVAESNPEVHRMNLVNAELAKISVNTFVTTKISYANMIADICERLPDADAELVTRAVGADSRIGRKYLKPAIGYGGPCFPRDNIAFASLGRALGADTALAEATDAINRGQIDRILRAVELVAPRGAVAAVLGLSYKPNTGVIEESQGVALALRLADQRYSVRAFDPQANDAARSVLDGRVEVHSTLEAALAGASVAVLTTPWEQFRSVDWEKHGLYALVDPWGIAERTGAKMALIRLGRGRRGDRTHDRPAAA